VLAVAGYDMDKNQGRKYGGGVMADQKTKSSGRPWVTRLERSAEDLYEWGDDGQPGIGMFSQAISVWVWCQSHSPTIAEAAIAFNVAPALISEAIEFHGCF